VAGNLALYRHNLRQTSHRPDGTDAVAANAIEAALRTGKEP
jgi:hypothetical protein